MIPKYRAFDKVSKIMYEVKGWETVIKNGQWTSDITLRVTTTSGAGGYIDLNKVILMQSTGLKDKHGVEMFEFDIIKETPQYYDYERPFILEKVNDLGASLGMSAGWHLQQDNWERHSPLQCKLPEDDENYFVAGNAFENIDLYKQANIFWAKYNDNENLKLLEQYGNSQKI